MAGTCGSGLLALFTFLLKVFMDTDRHATGSDSHMLDELLELLVVADAEVDVLGADGLLLRLLAHIASKLENLGGDVLEDSGHEGTSGG